MTNTEKRILIAGAGIAGPTLGYWLSRLGHEVTIVERAPSLRLTGQTVDIRDEGRDVIARMGLSGRVEERMTNEDGLRFVDDHNRVRAEYPRAGGKKAFVTDIEILRADFRVFFRKSRRVASSIFTATTSLLATRRKTASTSGLSAPEPGGSISC